MKAHDRIPSLKTSTVTMTCGDIRRGLLAFTLSIRMGNLFQQLYSMVDTAVVGRGVGAQALAARWYHKSRHAASAGADDRHERRNVGGDRTA